MDKWTIDQFFDNLKDYEVAKNQFDATLSFRSDFTGIKQRLNETEINLKEAIADLCDEIAKQTAREILDRMGHEALERD